MAKRARPSRKSTMAESDRGIGDLEVRRCEECGNVALRMTWADSFTTKVCIVARDGRAFAALIVEVCDEIEGKARPH